MSTTEQKAPTMTLGEWMKEDENTEIRRLSAENEALRADLEAERAAFKICAQERYNYHASLVDMRYQLTAVTNERDALRAQVEALTRDTERQASKITELCAELEDREARHQVDRERLQTIHEHQQRECWYWQGDGEDHLESMVNSLPVVIRADQLRALTKPAAALMQARDLLSTSIGLVMGWKEGSNRDFYKTGSVVDKHVQEVVEFLKPWPESAPSPLTRPAPFPERDTSRPAEQQGLFRKFAVSRVDGSDAPGGKHHGCEYFVLDMDHDKAAPAALVAYADAVAETHPQLAADLRARFGKSLTRPAVPEGWDQIEQIATTRYKVTKSDSSMFHRHAVVAGDGERQLYLGREVECEIMARKFAGAFLDGAYLCQQMLAAAPQPPGEVVSSDDLVLVPRGLLGSACAVMCRSGVPHTETLAALRRYTVGDLSAAAPQPEAQPTEAAQKGGA